MMAKLPIPYPQPGWEPTKPETRVCMKVDAEACARLIDSTLSRDWLKPALTN